MLLTQRDEFHQLLLGVRRIGVVHGRATVTEAPFRAKGGFTGQFHQFFGDIQRGRADKQVVIQIPGFGAETAVWQMVVVQLSAKIKPDIAEIVVEQAETDVVTAGQGKRNMFV